MDMDELRALCASSGDEDEDNNFINISPPPPLPTKDDIPSAMSPTNSKSEVCQPHAKRRKVDVSSRNVPNISSENQKGTDDKDRQSSMRETLLIQQEAMKKIAQDSKKTAQSFTAKSEKRRESMRNIMKEPINTEPTKKKTIKRVTVYDKMEHERTKAGPLKILYNCMKYGIKAKVWIRRYKGVRGVITGYIVAFDLYMNLAMIDISEVYCIETWMIGDPLPKNKRNRKKINNCSSIVETVKENKLEKDCVNVKLKSSHKKESTSAYLKQLTEKMKTSFSPTLPNVDKEKEVATSINKTKEDKQASIISDDLWSVLQNINVDKLQGVGDQSANPVIASKIPVTVQSSSLIPGTLSTITNFAYSDSVVATSPSVAQSHVLHTNPHMQVQGQIGNVQNRMPINNQIVTAPYSFETFHQNIIVSKPFGLSPNLGIIRKTEELRLAPSNSNVPIITSVTGLPSSSYSTSNIIIKKEIDSNDKFHAPDSVCDPRLSRRNRGTTVVHKPSIKEKGLPSNLNMTATEKAVILCDFGMARDSSTIQVSHQSSKEVASKGSKEVASKSSKELASKSPKEVANKSPKEVANKSSKDGHAILKQKHKSKRPSSKNISEIPLAKSFLENVNDMKDVVVESDTEREYEGVCSIEELPNATWLTSLSTDSRKENMKEQFLAVSHQLELQVDTLKMKSASQKQQESKSKTKSKRKLKDLTEMDIHRILGSIHENSDSDSNVTSERVDENVGVCKTDSLLSQEDDLYKDVIPTVEDSPNIKTQNAEINMEGMNIEKSPKQGDVWNDVVFNAITPAKRKVEIKKDLVTSMTKKEISSSSKKQFVDTILNKNETAKKDMVPIPENEMLDISLERNKCTFHFHSIAKRLKEIKSSRPLPRVESKMVKTVATNMTPLFETNAMKGELSTTDEEPAEDYFEVLLSDSSKPAVSDEIDVFQLSKPGKGNKKKKYKKGKKTIRDISVDMTSDKSKVGIRNKLETISDDELEDDPLVIGTSPISSDASNQRLESVSPEPLIETDDSGNDGSYDNSNENKHKVKRSCKRDGKIIDEFPLEKDLDDEVNDNFPLEKDPDEYIDIKEKERNMNKVEDNTRNYTEVIKKVTSGKRSDQDVSQESVLLRPKDHSKQVCDIRQEMDDISSDDDVLTDTVNLQVHQNVSDITDSETENALNQDDLQRKVNISNISDDSNSAHYSNNSPEDLISISPPSEILKEEETENSLVSRGEEGSEVNDDTLIANEVSISDKSIIENIIEKVTDVIVQENVENKPEENPNAVFSENLVSKEEDLCIRIHKNDDEMIVGETLVDEIETSGEKVLTQGTEIRSNFEEKTEENPNTASSDQLVSKEDLYNTNENDDDDNEMIVDEVIENEVNTSGKKDLTKETKIQSNIGENPKTESSENLVSKGDFRSTNKDNGKMIVDGVIEDYIETSNKKDLATEIPSIESTSGSNYLSSEGNSEIGTLLQSIHSDIPSTIKCVDDIKVSQDLEMRHKEVIQKSKVDHPELPNVNEHVDVEIYSSCTDRTLKSERRVSKRRSKVAGDEKSDAATDTDSKTHGKTRNNKNNENIDGRRRSSRSKDNKTEPDKSNTVQFNEKEGKRRSLRKTISTMDIKCVGETIVTPERTRFSTRNVDELKINRKSPRKQKQDVQSKSAGKNRSQSTIRSTKGVKVTKTTDVILSHSSIAVLTNEEESFANKDSTTVQGADSESSSKKQTDKCDEVNTISIDKNVPNEKNSIEIVSSETTSNSKLSPDKLNNDSPIKIEVTDDGPDHGSEINTENIENDSCTNVKEVLNDNQIIEAESDLVSLSKESNVKQEEDVGPSTDIPKEEVVEDNFEVQSQVTNKTEQSCIDVKTELVEVQSASSCLLEEEISVGVTCPESNKAHQSALCVNVIEIEEEKTPIDTPLLEQETSIDENIGVLCHDKEQPVVNAMIKQEIDCESKDIVQEEASNAIVDVSGDKEVKPGLTTFPVVCDISDASENEEDQNKPIKDKVDSVAHKESNISDISDVSDEELTLFQQTGISDISDADEAKDCVLTRRKTSEISGVSDISDADTRLKNISDISDDEDNIFSSSNVDREEGLVDISDEDTEESVKHKTMSESDNFSDNIGREDGEISDDGDGDDESTQSENKDKDLRNRHRESSNYSREERRERSRRDRHRSHHGTLKNESSKYETFPLEKYKDELEETSKFSRSYKIEKSRFRDDDHERTSSKEKGLNYKEKNSSSSRRSPSHMLKSVVHKSEQAASSRSPSSTIKSVVHKSKQAASSRSPSRTIKSVVHKGEQSESNRTSEHRDLVVERREKRHEEERRVSSGKSKQSKEGNRERGRDSLPPDDLRKKMQSERIKSKIERAVRHLRHREASKARELEKRSSKIRDEKRNFNSSEERRRHSLRDRSKEAGRSKGISERKDERSQKRLKVKISGSRVSVKVTRKISDDERTSDVEQNIGPGNKEDVKTEENELFKFDEKNFEPEQRDLSKRNTGVESEKKDMSKRNEDVESKKKDMSKRNEDVSEKKDLSKRNENVESEKKDLSNLNPFQRRNMEKKMKRTCDGTEKDYTIKNPSVRDPNELLTNLNNDGKETLGSGFLRRRMHHRLQKANEHTLLLEEKEKNIYERIMRDITPNNYGDGLAKNGVIFKERHVNQLFIRGDNIVMIAYEDPENVRKMKMEKFAPN